MTSRARALAFVCLCFVAANAAVAQDPVTSTAGESTASSRPHAALPQPPGGPYSLARHGVRLVVLFVVDQLGTDVLRSAWPFLSDGGFRRLDREGTSYWKCQYDHADSETGPGHATLSTGATPSIHGIVANEWPDPTRRSTLGIVGCVADPSVAMPGAKASGRSPKNLRAPTLGDAMKTAFGPTAKVVSVSLKDRAAILMGGRSADLAAWYDKNDGRFVTSRAYSPTEPALLARLNARHLADAFQGKTWTLLGREAQADQAADAYASLGPDENDLEKPLFGRRSFPRVYGEGSVPFHESLVSSPAGNEMVLDAARAAFDEFTLGADDVPDLLCISMSSTDAVGHDCGPNSYESRDLIRRIDRLLGDLCDQLDEKVGPGRWTLIATGDHGVGPIPALAETIVRDAGQSTFRVREEDVIIAIEHAFDERFKDVKKGPWVYRARAEIVALKEDAIRAAGVELRLTQEIGAAAAARVPGIYTAFGIERLLDAGFTGDDLHDSVRRAIHVPQSGDIYVVPEPYHVFASETRPASHGTPWLYDRRVPLFLVGPAIRRGYASDAVVAPGSAVVTIAEALGVGGPAAANHPVLSDALK